MAELVLQRRRRQRDFECCRFHRKRHSACQPDKGTHDRITAGSGADTLIAGAGSDTLSGGPGADTFAFFSQFTAGAHEYVTHLTASDAVDLFGYGHAPKSTSTAHGSTTITLSDNTKITFVDVTHPNNIRFL